jgi:L-ascorbate metabolism protein UlaG (beta-lactamase superfamily)
VLRACMLTRGGGPLSGTPAHAIAGARLTRLALGMSPEGQADGLLSPWITFLGHATVLIETGGTKVLTDPAIRSRIAHLRRIVPVGAVPELGSTDVVLISHAHHDHLDLPSLRRLAAAAAIVVPRGFGKLVRRAGFDEVREVEAGDRVAIGEVEVLATPARHNGRRWPLGRAARALGYVVQCPQRIYFAGDTDLFDGMGDLAVNLNLALLPVAGWGPRLPPGHLDPERAARAVALLRPTVAVPIHWGTFASRTFTAPRAQVSDPERPAREFARLARSYAPEVEVRILRPGERMSLDR